MRAETQRRRFNGVAGLVLTAVLFLTVLLVSNSLFKGLRVDLTENQVYSLSDGTKQMLGKLDEPLHLRYYYSKSTAQGLPSVQSYATRVGELLAEFAASSDGKIRLSNIDPEPFSEQEDEAAGFGLQGIPTNNGNKLYFGLAATNSLGDEYTVPFFQPNRERFLEYEVSKLIYDLANPKKRVLGVLGGLPVFGRAAGPQGQPAEQPWVLFQQLNQFFEVRPLGALLTEVPEDIDVLMVVHPKNLSDQSLYALDQYILGGGHAMLFTDPFAERDAGDPMDPMGGAIKSSDLNSLYRHWGIEQASNQFVADRQQALQVQVAVDRPPVSHLGLLALMEESVAQESIITQGIQQINMASTGYFKTLPSGDNSQFLTVEPLLESSAVAMPMPAERMNYLPDPSVLQASFKPTGERYLLAARLSGVAKTAFPDGQPQAEEGSEADMSKHLAVSAAPVNLIVVADTDILSDRLWVQIQNIMNQQIATPWAGNGDFIVNALDGLSGSSDLINIRSRGVYSRPFEKVQALRVEAEDKFRDKEQELQAELQETERKLSELQSSANEGNTFSLTPQQQAALLEFQEQQLRIRKELREVRHQLDKDIDRLGVKLMVINIALIPLLLIFFAIGRGLWRKRQAAGQ